MANTQQVMLITGSNSGIGLATAKLAVAAGYLTFGGARRKETFEAVTAVGAQALYLDVTDEHSVAEAVSQIEAHYGAIDVLVNNAGFGQMGAVEQVSLENWYKQYATNVFGLVRTAQLVIPAMRRQRRGRIINISSMGGEFTFPLAGAYHSTKYAVESINDALRFELKPFGIDVISVQPGPVATPLAHAAGTALQPSPDDPYEPLIAAFTRMSAQQGSYLSPEQVAQVIVRAARTRRPRARYKVGLMARVMPRLRHALPDRMWDGLIGRLYR